MSLKQNNKQKILKIMFFLTTGIFALNFQALAQDTVDATTLTGKYMVGYQAWQRANGDGCNSGWFHWIRSGSVPDGTNMTVDVFPDLTEYTASELFPTNMHYNDGSTVKLYSTCNETTVMRHFKWMKDYNIDGAWIQRFGPRHVGWTESTNKSLLASMKGAEANGRVFVVMYDVSGAGNSTLFDNMTKDWMYLVDTFKVTQSVRYLKHRGKPLVSVWGLGFPDRSITADVATKIIQWFQTDAPAKYQATVMAGVISSGGVNWRTLAEPWASAVRTADIISPWFVGSFNTAAESDGWKTSRLDPDIAECKKLGKEYLPVVWPGFSWSNMHGGSSPQNQIPRLGGKFFWEQAYNSISAGSTMLYNAMFDEIDEGTAMLKICPTRAQAPKEGYWLTADADGYQKLPSDWYLQLAGYANKMLKKQIPLSKTMPIDPNDPHAVSVGKDDHRSSIPSARDRISMRAGTLDIKLGSGEKAMVALYRMDGKEQQVFECRGLGRTTHVPLFSQGNIPNGTYLLKVKVDNGIVESKILAITR
jgi:hypothetical protein